MSVKTEAIGKEWPATTYEVGKEKIGEYARVLGIENPVHFDREAAKAAGFRDVVAPPMFASSTARRRWRRRCSTPRWG